MSLPPIQSTTTDGVTTVKLQRPPANAIDVAFARELTAILAEHEASDDARALVVTGTGQFFSAGLDLKSVPGMPPEQQRQMILAFGQMVARLYGFPRPVVAAVNGHAVAGGLLLALTCDHRVGPLDESCRFGLTGVKAGIPYPASAMAIINAELTPAAARAMLLRAETFGPNEALGRDVLDELQPPNRVLARALEVAADLAAMPGATYARTKHQLRGPTVASIVAAIQAGSDPTLDSWLTAESASASDRILGDG